MNPILRNILAVIAGLAVGFIVNMGLIILSPMVIPPPEGVDPTNSESLAAGMHLFSFKHFIMPFLAHALGVLAGAFVAAKIAATRKLVFALVIGGFFLIGGIMMVIQMPAPIWFDIVDLTLAYFPMAFIGAKLAGSGKEAE